MRPRPAVVRPAGAATEVPPYAHCRHRSCRKREPEQTGNHCPWPNSPEKSLGWQSLPARRPCSELRVRCNAVCRRRTGTNLIRRRRRRLEAGHSVPRYLCPTPQRTAMECPPAANAKVASDNRRFRGDVQHRPKCSGLRITRDQVVSCRGFRFSRSRTQATPILPVQWLFDDRGASHS